MHKPLHAVSRMLTLLLPLSLLALCASCAGHEAPPPLPPTVVVKPKVEYVPIPSELLRPQPLPPVPVDATKQSQIVPYLVSLEKAVAACEIDRAAVAKIYKDAATPPSP